jgi:hypothetical protein
MGQYRNPLDLIERYLIARPIVEFRRPRGDSCAAIA